MSHTTLKNLFSGKNILIIGVGYSNVSVIKQLSTINPASIIATDLMNDADELEKLQQNIDKIKDLYPNCKFILGHHDIDLSKIDIAIKSPSISEEIPFIQSIRNAGIPIETDVSIFFKLIPREKVIGITGTKGKSTTTTLLHKALVDQRVSATISGNIGIPVLEHLDEHLNADIVVVELSSFMIHSLHQFRLSPRIMIVTSLGQDHLDFHRTPEQYERDKLSILTDQKVRDLAFINSDEKRLFEIVERFSKNITYYSAEDVREKVSTMLRGRHYLSNISGVLQVCRHLLKNTFDFDRFKQTVSNFEPLTSRMETRRIYGHVEYINNSKATDTNAFCADLTTLIDENAAIYILCGGEDKGLDLTYAGNLLNSPQVKAIALFNNAGSKRLASYIEKQKILGYFDTVSAAFKKVHINLPRDTTKKCVVILMPGTGTYGIFKNKHGSDSFNECVKDVQ